MGRRLVIPPPKTKIDWREIIKDSIGRLLVLLAGSFWIMVWIGVLHVKHAWIPTVSYWETVVALLILQEIKAVTFGVSGSGNRGS